MTRARRRPRRMARAPHPRWLRRARQRRLRAERRDERMAMNVGGGGDRKMVTPNMNVTPLVDVVLVLLIIFIVITPQLTRKFWVHTPKQEKKEVEPQNLTQDPSPPLVLRVDDQKHLNVNGAEVEFQELPGRLRRVLSEHGARALYIYEDDR